MDNRGQYIKRVLSFTNPDEIPMEKETADWVTRIYTDASAKTPVDSDKTYLYFQLQDVHRTTGKIKRYPEIARMEKSMCFEKKGKDRIILRMERLDQIREIGNGQYERNANGPRKKTHTFMWTKFDRNLYRINNAKVFYQANKNTLSKIRQKARLLNDLNIHTGDIRVAQVWEDTLHEGMKNLLTEIARGEQNTAVEKNFIRWDTSRQELIDPEA